MVTFLRVPLGAALLHPDRHATKVCGLAGRGGKAAPTSKARRFFTRSGTQPRSVDWPFAAAKPPRPLARHRKRCRQHFTNQAPEHRDEGRVGVGHLDARKLDVKLTRLLGRLVVEVPADLEMVGDE